MLKIGLEVHVPLNKLNTKLFCSCKIPDENSEPNSATCEICLGMPGSKPVLNKIAVEYALKLALALNFKMNKSFFFSRKTYFYPDMTKNYQITQYEVPIGENGHITLNSGKKISIRRIHLEEDPGALIHYENYVLIDYNRAGIPLCEIVTEPDISSAEEAREFIKKLDTIIGYIGIFDNKKGSIKADVNVSIKGYERVEIKNVNGFQAIEKAVIYESTRQEDLIKKDKGVSIRETRGWDADRNITIFQRLKESEEDYGYIFDTDLTMIELSDDYLDGIKSKIPELPGEKIKKYVNKLKINAIDAEILAAEHSLANLFEKVAKEINPLIAARWLRHELLRVANYNKRALSELEIDERHVIQLLKFIESKQITDNNAQKILEKLIEKPFDVDEYVKQNKLRVISDESDLVKVVKDAVKENPNAVKDYKSGKEESFNFIVGQIMKKTKGQAKPDVLKALLKKELE